MKYNIEIDSAQVIAKFENAPRSVETNLFRTIKLLAEKLRTHIVRDKLMGQVLKRQSGRLGQSIQAETTRKPGNITGIVYSAGDVKYAAIHEYGGRTKPHVIEAKNKKALAFMFRGKMAIYRKVNHPGSVMPERSFMRSGLTDMRQEITSKIALAVVKGMQQ